MEPNQQNLPERQEKFQKQIAPIIEIANRMVVRNPMEFQQAAGHQKINKKAQAEVHAFFDPICDASYAAWKQATKGRARFLDPLEKSYGIVKTKMEDYQSEEDRKAQEEARRINAENEERARKERERIEAQARKAAERGKPEKAEALQEKAEEVVATVVQVESAAPKVEGISSRKQWKVKSIDRAKFLPFVAQDQTGMFSACVDIKEGLLERMAKGDKAPTIPGVEFYLKTIIGSRGEN